MNKKISIKGFPLRRTLHVLALVFMLFAQTLPDVAYGQCPKYTSKGRDFWLMFLTATDLVRNSMAVYATGDSNAVITVEIPRANWQQTMNLTGGGWTSMSIPYTIVHTLIMDSVLDEGIHVYSTASISLCAKEGMGHATDRTLVLPTSTLRDRYIAQTYPPDTNPATNTNEIGVVAVEDSTVITITGYGNVTLMRGQTFQHSSNTSLSGVEVYSNHKPFAMFQGNDLMFIPHGYIPGDDLYEQSIPVDDWGQDFAIVPSAGRVGRGEAVRITSSQDSCDIYFGGTLVAHNLRRCATFDTIVPYANAIRVYTTQPCCVFQYLTGVNYGDTTGDPSSVVVTPLDQGVCEADFVDNLGGSTISRYVNIVTETRNVQNITLDGSSVASSFVALDNVYSYARIPITVREHYVKSTGGPFVGHTYGMQNAESYAFSIGMKMCNLHETLLVNGSPTLHDTIEICLNDTLDVRLRTTAMDTSVRWYIDGNLMNINTLSFRHTFDTSGLHTITALTHGLCDTVWCDTLRAFVRVFAPYSDTLRTVICEGDSFAFFGTYYTQSGQYSHYLSVANDCDSVIVLDLTVLARPQLSIERSGNFCLEGVATLRAVTDGNTFTWSAMPPDSSLIGQEHNAVIRVSPQRNTVYSVVVDSMPRLQSCSSHASVALRHPMPVNAAFIMSPKEITLDNLQMMFTDITVGEIVQRKWSFIETPNISYGATVYDKQVAYYTAHSENDSLHVRLAVVTSDGCTDTTDEDYPILKSALWVPNSFTPEGHFNTLFQVGAYNISDYEIHIYNRAGLLVFHSTEPYDSWDGTYKGKPCVPASYVYVIDYKTTANPNKPEKKVGSVLLIR